MVVWAGLGAALAFGAATLAAARASRTIGPASTLGWQLLVGLVLVVPLVALSGGARPHGETVGWLCVAGAGNVAGLGLMYRAMQSGALSVAVPIASAEGAVAAIIAALVGQPVSPAVGLALGFVAVGVGLVATHHAPPPRRLGGTACLAAVAALTFGVSIYAAGRASLSLEPIWAAVPARVVGVILVTLPMAAIGRLELRRPALPFIIFAGVGEVTGFWLFAVGAQEEIAVAAVLASLSALVATLGGVALYGEKVSRLQGIGIVLTMAGVAALPVLL